MKTIKKYYFEEIDRIRFIQWLRENDLNMSQYARLCGVSKQMIFQVVKGIKPIPKSFLKGGYDYETYTND